MLQPIELDITLVHQAYLAQDSLGGEVRGSGEPDDGRRLKLTEGDVDAGLSDLGAPTSSPVGWQKAVPDLNFVALVEHQIPHAGPTDHLPRSKITQDPYAEAVVGFGPSAEGAVSGRPSVAPPADAES